MVNPQVENGYTRIANEILEALCKVRIPGEARQILDVILRKTYGFKKKEDAIALSTFSEMTGMPRPTCSRAISRLVEMKIIKVDKDGFVSKYSINKNYKSWQMLSKKITAKKEITVDKNDNSPLSKMITDIDKNDNKTVDKNDNIKRNKETLKKLFKESRSFEKSSDEIRLSKLLYSLMKENNPKAKSPDFQSWASHIDKMIRIDKRTSDEIEGAIRWSQQDSFWCANILSTKKLREKFDTLFLQAKRNNQNGRNNGIFNPDKFKRIAAEIANDPDLE